GCAERRGGVRGGRSSVRERGRAHDGGSAPGPRAVDRKTGRLARPLAGRGWHTRPDPIPRRGAADLDGGPVRPAFERAARHFDGWFANEADLGRWIGQGAEVQQILSDSGSDGRSGARAVLVAVEIGWIT